MKMYNPTMVAKLPAPGRELDALIAEKVMGDLIWEIWFAPVLALQDHDPNGIRYACQSKAQAESYLPSFPAEWKATIMEPSPEPYSTDIAAAWEIVTKLGGAFNLTHLRWWTASFTDEHQWPGGPHAAEGATAAEAICLAALVARGVLPKEQAVEGK